MNYTNVRTVAEYQGSLYEVETDQAKGQRVTRVGIPTAHGHDVTRGDWHKQVVLADGTDGHLYILVVAKAESLSQTEGR